MTIRVLEDLAIEFKSKGESNLQMARDMTSQQPSSVSPTEHSPFNDAVDSKVILFEINFPFFFVLVTY